MEVGYPVGKSAKHCDFLRMAPSWKILHCRHISDGSPFSTLRRAARIAPFAL